MKNAKEILLLSDAIAKEYGITQNNVLSFLAAGIETAVRKEYPEGAVIRSEIDPKTGAIRVWREFQLVDQIEDVEAQMLFNEVEDEEVRGDVVIEPIELNLSRQQLNVSKQVAFQKIREQSRNEVLNAMLAQPSNLYTGILRQVRKENVIIDYHGTDILMPKRNMLYSDRFKIGERVRFTLDEEDGKITASRTSNKFLREALKEEVHAVASDEVEIVAIARNPGNRSKIIVKPGKEAKGSTNPVNLVVGKGGHHAKRIRSQLGGEFLDVIEQTDNLAEMLVRCLHGCQLTKIMIDEDDRVIEAAVKDEDIAQAVGKKGSNIKLIRELLGWEIKIYPDTQWEEREKLQTEAKKQTFMFALDCDEDLASFLIEAGVETVEELAALSKSQLGLDDLEDETFDAIVENAKGTLGNPELAEKTRGIQDLCMLGFTGEEVEVLMNQNILSIENLADLSWPELEEILPSIQEERGGQLILLARRQIED